jgi:hypothetical protein
MFYLLNYKSEMKENAILCRIKILKAIFVEKINNRKLSRKIKVHYNTIWNIKKIFNLNSNIWDKKIIINSSKN